jgi:hypothetical protein
MMPIVAIIWGIIDGEKLTYCSLLEQELLLPDLSF